MPHRLAASPTAQKPWHCWYCTIGPADGGADADRLAKLRAAAEFMVDGRKERDSQRQIGLNLLLKKSKNKKRCAIINLLLKVSRKNNSVSYYKLYN